jgi:hypothetical protein
MSQGWPKARASAAKRFERGDLGRATCRRTIIGVSVPPSPASNAARSAGVARLGTSAAAKTNSRRCGSALAARGLQQLVEARDRRHAGCSARVTSSEASVTAHQAVRFAALAHDPPPGPEAAGPRQAVPGGRTSKLVFEGRRVRQGHVTFRWVRRTSSPQGSHEGTRDRVLPRHCERSLRFVQSGTAGR